MEWWYLSLLRTNLRSEGVPVVGESARTPLEQCWGTTEQGTEPSFPHGALQRARDSLNVQPALAWKS